MEDTAQLLLDAVDKAYGLMQSITETDAAIKPAANKWSKKEILGHLVDSALNNQQKFVRTLLANPSTEFVGYDQDAWVAVQQYNTQRWENILSLWVMANKHLAHIMQTTDASKLNHSITVNGKGPYSLKFIMHDYVEHLKHHLGQILPEAGFSSHFSMEPYV